MGDKITFYMLSTSGTSARQATVSRSFLKFLAVLVLFFLVAAAGVGYDYHRLRRTAFDNRRLEERVSHQMDEMALQREQIRSFAQEIDGLKSKLLALTEFERQIRVVAGLEDLSTEEGIFGIGGSIPEDLRPGADLGRKHKALVREMHERIEHLGTAASVREDGFEDLLAHIGRQRNLLASRPSINPVRGLVTSVFGTRRSPFTGLREFHNGLDIANREGTKIKATADGEVTFVGGKGTYGLMMTVTHGHGMATRYAHLKECLKQCGEKVKRGDVIALMGDSGRTTGPHLHYEVRLNGVPMDPREYILD